MGFIFLKQMICLYRCTPPWTMLPLLVGAAMAAAATPQAPAGNVSAVYDLLDRVLPAGSSEHFDLSLGAGCLSGFVLADSAASGKVQISGATASDLSAGVGYYLMEYANLTFGWPRGGGSNMVLPAPDETAILLHPPLPLVGVSTVMERERQQNDSLVNG